MLLTRTKCSATENFLSLSAVKTVKKRKLAQNVVNVSQEKGIEASHKCKPSCNRSNLCPVNGSENIDRSVLNVSDHNENDVQDILAEIESVNGENSSLAKQFCTMTMRSKIH